MKLASRETAWAIFARTPARGQVKTRLAATIGDDDALALSIAFIDDALQAIVDELPAAPAYLYLTTPWNQALAPLPAPIARARVQVRYQPPGDLGARMLAALTELIAEHGSAIIWGADCPTLPAEYLHQASQ